MTKTGVTREFGLYSTLSVDVEAAAATITKQASGTHYFAFEYAVPLPLLG
jgi:hypothetical protein